MTSASDNGTYTFKQMLQQEDRYEFITAMINEIKDHDDKNHWNVMLRSDLPPCAKIVLVIWSFKRKRLPDGRIQKYKARMCACGGIRT